MTGAIVGFILVVVGVACVAFGLLTDAMPPFPSKVASYISYRDEEPLDFWTNGALYAALAICGCYLIITHWSAFLESLS